MRFYRGLSVPRHEAEGVVTKIRSQGLQPKDGWWDMTAADLKPRLEEIWRKPKVTYADTRPVAPKPTWVCACAEVEGALHYAHFKNKTADKDTPIMISFDAEPLSEAIVDGRDFLYALFQFGAPERARPVAERIFGSGILRYLERAWSTDDAERVALCDLARQDDAVVLAHAANKLVIGGKYDTRFRSAFFVKTPVSADRIVDVTIIESDFHPPNEEVFWRDFMR
jgi:hypothetical protein